MTTKLNFVRASSNIRLYDYYIEEYEKSMNLYKRIVRLDVGNKYALDRINEINFTVNVPVAVSFDATIMASRIDFYNQAGKNYEIQTY